MVRLTAILTTLYSLALADQAPEHVSLLQTRAEALTRAKYTALLEEQAMLEEGVDSHLEDASIASLASDSELSSESELESEEGSGGQAESSEVLAAFAEADASAEAEASTEEAEVGAGEGSGWFDVEHLASLVDRQRVNLRKYELPEDRKAKAERARAEGLWKANATQRAQALLDVTTFSAADAKPRQVLEDTHGVSSAVRQSLEGSASEFGGLVDEGTDLTDMNASLVEARIDMLVRDSERMVSVFEKLRAGEVPLKGQVASSIGFIKTHRTGSSTLANILHRLGDRQGSAFVLPKGHADASALGWPGAFPGTPVSEAYGVPSHQFDLIVNNAVFNHAKMREYLKLEPFFFTLLRQPVAQMVSSLDYFKPPCGKSWDSRIAWLQNLYIDPAQAIEDMGSRGPALKAAFLNPQAHDLGWYEHTDGALDLDGDEAAIKNWLSGLQKEVGLVLLTEHFDEGLVLLRRKLGLELQDMVYIRMKVPPPRRALEDKQHQVLMELPRVDQLAYSHFAEVFWAEWAAAGGDEMLRGEVHELRTLNRALVQACNQEEDDVCPWSFRADMVEYTEYLQKRQVDRPLMYAGEMAQVPQIEA